jgi:hypothetical protein
MRASPYDLRDFGFAPIAVETADGRREYATAQESLSVRAAPLRERLLRACVALRDAGRRSGPGISVFTGG